MRRVLGYAILTAVLTSGSITVQAQAVKPQAGDYVIDFDLAWAMFTGKAEDGRSISRIALEMEGKTVFLKDAFVYGHSDQTGMYTVFMGDNTPRILCEQTSRDKRLHAMDKANTKGSYSVRGRYKSFSGGRFTLTECEFQKLS